MQITNFEFKAKVNDLHPYEEKLKRLNPRFVGRDHQVDTYFNASVGRLKLREGTIENALIQYVRDDLAASKVSKITLYKHQPDAALKSILTTQFGLKVVVEKVRKIYYLDHVKFHFDEVSRLGTFIEVEVIDESNQIPKDELKATCDHFFEFFALEASSLIKASYSDLLLMRETDPE